MTKGNFTIDIAEKLFSKRAHKVEGAFITDEKRGGSRETCGFFKWNCNWPFCSKTGNVEIYQQSQEPKKKTLRMVFVSFLCCWLWRRSGKILSKGASRFGEYPMTFFSIFSHVRAKKFCIVRCGNELEERGEKRRRGISKGLFLFRELLVLSSNSVSIYITANCQ